MAIVGAHLHRFVCLCPPLPAFARLCPLLPTLPYRHLHRLLAKRRRREPLLTCLARLSPVSRWDRLLIFGACNLAAAACFSIAFFTLPILALRPTKFVSL